MGAYQSMYKIWFIQLCAVTSVTILCWRVYPCDQSLILVAVCKYCAYHRFTRLRHSSEMPVFRKFPDLKFSGYFYWFQDFWQYWLASLKWIGYSRWKYKQTITWHTPDITSNYPFLLFTNPTSQTPLQKRNNTAPRPILAGWEKTVGFGCLFCWDASLVFWRWCCSSSW